MSSAIRIRLAPIHHAGYQASNRINRPLPPHFEKCGGNYKQEIAASTFAARLLGNCHIPTLPRHGMGSARRLTFERSHHNLIFAILRPLDSVKNHNRIRSCAGKGVHDRLNRSSIYAEDPNGAARGAHFRACLGDGGFIIAFARCYFRIARHVRFPMGREPPQGADTQAFLFSRFP